MYVRLCWNRPSRFPFYPREIGFRNMATIVFIDFDNRKRERNLIVQWWGNKRTGNIRMEMKSNPKSKPIEGQRISPNRDEQSRRDRPLALHGDLPFSLQISTQLPQPRHSFTFNRNRFAILPPKLRFPVQTRPQSSQPPLHFLLHPTATLNAIAEPSCGQFIRKKNLLLESITTFSRGGSSNKIEIVSNLFHKEGNWRSLKSSITKLLQFVTCL